MKAFAGFCFSLVLCGIAAASHEQKFIIVNAVELAPKDFDLFGKGLMPELEKSLLSKKFVEIKEGDRTFLFGPSVWFGDEMAKNRALYKEIALSADSTGMLTAKADSPILSAVLECYQDSSGYIIPPDAKFGLTLVQDVTLTHNGMKLSTLSTPQQAVSEPGAAGITVLHRGPLPSEPPPRKFDFYASDRFVIHYFGKDSVKPGVRTAEYTRGLAILSKHMDDWQGELNQFHDFLAKNLGRDRLTFDNGTPFRSLSEADRSKLEGSFRSEGHRLGLSESQIDDAIRQGDVSVTQNSWSFVSRSDNNHELIHFIP